MGESDQAGKPATAFELNGDEILTARQKARRLTVGSYQHRLAYYCEQYGKRLDDGSVKVLDRKTIERWIKRGREVEGSPDLPPLDHPELMAEWYRRTMERKVPKVLQIFEDVFEEAGAARLGAEDDVEGMVLEAGAATREAMKKALVMADAAGLGFEAALERSRLAERLSYTQWQVVLMEPENYPDSVIAKRKKAWEEASGVLLRAEEKAEKIMDRSSEWARWEDVEREQAEKLSVLAVGIRSLLTRVATKAPLPPGVFDALNRSFQREVDKLFSVLGQGQYRPALELQAE